MSLQDIVFKEFHTTKGLSMHWPRPDQPLFDVKRKYRVGKTCSFHLLLGQAPTGARGQGLKHEGVGDPVQGPWNFHSVCFWGQQLFSTTYFEKLYNPCVRRWWLRESILGRRWWSNGGRAVVGPWYVVVLEVEGGMKVLGRKANFTAARCPASPHKALWGTCFQESNSTSPKHLFLTMSVSAFIFSQF